MLGLIAVLLSASAFALNAVLFGSDVQQLAAPVTVVTTAETLILVGNAVTLPTGNGKAVIRGWLDVTVGASTTAISIAIYRGVSIAGVLVGSKNPEAGDFTPGSTSTFDIEVIDPLSGVAGAQYCMSITQTGASGNGSVINALIDTRVLSG